MPSDLEQPPPEVQVTVAATRENVGLVRHVLAGLGDSGAIDDEAMADILLAVSEAVTDAVLHAQGHGRLVVRAWLAPGSLSVAVRDPDEARRQLDTAALHAGLPTIAAVADRIEIRPAGDGVREVVMAFAV